LKEWEFSEKLLDEKKIAFFVFSEYSGLFTSRISQGPNEKTQAQNELIPNL